MWIRNIWQLYRPQRPVTGNEKPSSSKNFKQLQSWMLLGCYAVWLLQEPTFRRNLAPPSSGRQESVKFVLRNVCRLLVKVNFVPSSPILANLMMEALRSSEPPALTRATRRNIPKDDILHSHRRENLKSYTIAMLLLGGLGRLLQ
jgi:hypothetical protein